MLLRGIYLSTKPENDFYTRGGVGNFFPEEYEKLISIVPPNERKDVLGHYLKMMRHKDVKTQDRYAIAWSDYEGSILRLRKKKSPFDKKMSKSVGILEIHYLSQGCFFPEGYILKHAHMLKMPVSIVQGRYDMICPPLAAWQLKREIPHARLHFTIAGHSSSDPETKALLKREMRGFSRRKHLTRSSSRK